MAATLHSDRETTTTLRVRYAETDQMGVAYHANYLVWFEVARCEWFRGTGRTYSGLEASGTALPVIEAHRLSRRAARYDDEVRIRTRAQLLSPVRLRFDYAVLREGEEQPAASGWTIHGAVDRAGHPRRLPPEVRSLFA